MTERSVKVGINGRAFSINQPGGDVQAGMNLTRELIEHEDTEVVLFGHETLQDQFDCEVISKAFRPNSQVYGLLWEQVVLPKLTEKSDVDVLFCPNGNSPVYPSSTPVVLWIHSIFAYEGMAPKSYELLERLRVPRMLKHADVVATPSNYLGDQISRNFEFIQNEYTVIPNGVSKSLIQAKPTSVETPEEYILHVGGLNKRKNHSGVLKGYQKLVERTGTDVELVLVGPRDHDLIYENQSLDVSSHQNQIHNIGFVSESELRYLYENASLFIFPSWLETFGLPPVEAMYFGTPVVASNTSSLPQVLGNGAHYVEPKDSTSIAEGIQLVLTNQEYRDKLRRRGQEKAAEYTWEQAAEKSHMTLRTASQ